MTYNTMEDCHVSIATGDDAGAGAGLTNWINAKAAFIAGELKPCDKMLNWSIKPPIYGTERRGTMTTSRVRGRYSVGRQWGVWKSKHEFQTCQFIYWLMQTVGAPTTENTPVGYNTHALTIGTTKVPDWHGIHFERESITSNELRYDLMGCLPSELVIECGPGKEKFNATQEITIPFAYLNDSAGDIAAQTPRSGVATGTLTKDWSHLIAGLGVGKTPTGLTYNSLSLEVEITNLSLRLTRDFTFGTKDVTAYPIEGFMQGWDYAVTMDVVPIGNALYDLNKVKKESYAGDLDYDFKFEAEATNDNIRFLFDKMYLVPFDELNDWNKWIEGYTITLEPLDETSSLAITGIDGLDNTGFENP